jgi:hypothetical protein
LAVLERERRGSTDGGVKCAQRLRCEEHHREEKRGIEEKKNAEIVCKVRMSTVGLRRLEWKYDLPRFAGLQLYSATFLPMQWKVHRGR